MEHFCLPKTPTSKEITGRTLIDWYNDIFYELEIPEHIRPYVGFNDEMFIRILLAFGTDTLSDFWLNDEDDADKPLNEPKPSRKEVQYHMNSIVQKLHSRICHWDGWQQCDVFKEFTLNESGYRALLKGYEPNADNRYATYYHRGNFYLYRTGGIILLKFRYKKLRDGLYYMSACYKTDTPDAYQHLKEVFKERAE